MLWGPYGNFGSRDLTGAYRGKGGGLLFLLSLLVDLCCLLYCMSYRDGKDMLGKNRST